MALVGNGFRLCSSPIRYNNSSATVALSGGMAANIASFTSDGKCRNIWAGESDINLKSSVPIGARHPVSWRMAPNAGGIASRNETIITASTSGLAARGVPVSGSTEIVFSSDAFAGLLLFGSGSGTIDFNSLAILDKLTFALMQGEASISFSPVGAAIGARFGQGEATITISTAALIGAEAGIEGSATVTLSPAAQIYAQGFMSGLSTSETEFSATALANAVWQANASSYGESGTMGEKLNDSGSASNPWTEIIDGGYTAAEILRVISSVLYGKTIIDGTTIKFRDISDNKDRMTVQMIGSQRETISIDET